MMIDDAPPPPFVYDGLDPALEEKTVISEVTDAVKGTAQRISSAVRIRPPTRNAAEHIEQYRSRSTAWIAFGCVLLGVVVARRR